MRMVALVYAGAEELAQFLDACVVPYHRARGEWADLFEWNRYVDTSEVPEVKLILVDLDELDELRRRVMSVRELRREAMALADEADQAQRRGQMDRAQLLYQAALDQERAAIRRLATYHDSELSQTALYLSAASFAINSGQPEEAEHLITERLARSSTQR